MAQFQVARLFFFGFYKLWVPGIKIIQSFLDGEKSQLKITTLYSEEKTMPT
jgi:hypothetical protein